MNEQDLADLELKLTSKATTERFARLQRVIREHLGLEDDVPITLQTQHEDLGADSLDEVDLQMAVEDEFKIELPADFSADTRWASCSWLSRRAAGSEGRRHTSAITKPKVCLANKPTSRASNSTARPGPGT